MKSTKLYKINSKFAKIKSLPVYFIARELLATKKAVYLYGRGTTETKRMGVCCNCGRELTHPVSVELGIGPECGSHYWNWDDVGGFTEDNVARLTKKVETDIKVDTWIPKSAVKEVQDCTGFVAIPENHTMLQRKKKQPTKKQATKVTYQKSGEAGIKIVFPFDRTTITQVKTIPGRKYHNEGAEKYWSAPLSIEAVEKLIEFDFEIDAHLKTFLDNNKVKVGDLNTDIDIPGLGGELFPFQKEGVAFTEAKDGRVLIGDEMGLGKTVQALAWLQKHPEKRPALIVCPSSLKLNWKKEAEKWMSDPKIQILEGTKPTTPIIGDVIIINYHILNDWKEVLKEIKLQAIVADEIHKIKNNKAKRTKAFKFITKNIPHTIFLTGTPIVNRPQEIMNAVRIIDKSVIPNTWHFLQTYCGAKHTGFGWDFSGASNTKELHEKLTSTIMIRRLKKDVLTDLPEKMRSFVPLQLDNSKEYAQAESDFVEYIKDKTERDMNIELREKLGDDLFKDVEFKDHRLERMKEEKAAKAEAGGVLAQIEALKQICVKGKMKQSIKWIEDFLDSGEKLVVFCTHKFAVNELMSKFKDVAVKIDGSVSGEARDSAVERFQKNDGVKLFVGNIQAAGVGLTLTASSTVAFLELPWTPGDLNQAEDRVHRIGQKEAVNIHYLLADGTIEQKIAYLIDDKRKILDAVLDGKETEETSLLSELMNEYKQL